MTRWNEGVSDPYLPPELVLRQAEIGVIVADRQSNVLFANEYVARLLRVPADAARLVGQPLHALWYIPDGDLPKAADLSRQVLSGVPWEGTFAGARGDSTLVFLRVLAVPLRHPSGDIDGMVVLVTEAGRPDAQREQDRLRLLERIGWRARWNSTRRCGTSRRSSSRSSPTTASSTCSAATSSSGGCRRMPAAGSRRPGPGRRSASPSITRRVTSCNRPWRGSRPSWYRICTPSTTRRRARSPWPRPTRRG